MAVIGIFSLIFFLGNRHKDNIEQVELHVYLSHHVSEAEAAQLKNIISNKPYVKKDEGIPQLSYLSAEEAALDFVDQDQKAYLEMIETAGFNPVSARLNITIDKAFIEISQLEKIQKELEERTAIREVDLSLEKKEKIKDLRSNLNILKLILLGVIILSVFVVILLINNTIKLAMFSQRFLIRSMQLVGATSTFIRRPFVARSFAHGLFAGILSSGIIYSALILTAEQIPFLHELVDYNLLSVVFIGLALFGALLCSSSTYFAVNRYLKLSLDEMY